MYFLIPLIFITIGIFIPLTSYLNSKSIIKLMRKVINFNEYIREIQIGERVETSTNLAEESERQIINEMYHSPSLFKLQISAIRLFFRTTNESNL